MTIVARVGLALGLLASTVPLSTTGPWAALWTTPCILGASLLIAWGAESAQFFVAQGFALAILAWMQTLPEFAVEAVLAWKQQKELLLANLTGALRLLTGIAWPMIYFTSAYVCRRRSGRPLTRIKLHPTQSIEIIALFPPLAYATYICWKASLNIVDSIVLVILYSAYLALLTKLPPESSEGIEDLESVPRRIVQAPRPWRILAISTCFVIGGGLIYFTAEPFLGSLVALATAIGIPSFVVIQWLAPVISEFPELASTFYFARQEQKASIALMNIVSSNINQWTLLVAMLPAVYSLSRGEPSSFDLDPQQRTELFLTIAQSLVGVLFLLNMEFAWWEALTLFLLFVSQLALPPFFGSQAHLWITYAFLVWAAISMLRSFARGTLPKALVAFGDTWVTNFRN